MWSGISTVCFAASYLVALGLEVSRLYIRSRVRRGLTLGFALAGIVAQTMYLYSRAAENQKSPLASPYDWYLLAAWVLAVLYVLLMIGDERRAIGVFLLPLVLALIALAQFASGEPFAPAPASRGWGNVHGVCLLLGTIAVLVGFAAGIMYLAQSYRLKHKMLPTQGFRLPSLESLEKANSRALFISLLLFGAGFLSGIVLNQIKRGQHTGPVPWSDPVVVSSALMFAWLLAAWLFNRVYPAARRGRKVAYLTVSSFVFLIVTLVAVLQESSQHSPLKSDDASSAATHEAHDSHQPSGARMFALDRPSRRARRGGAA